MKSKPDNSELLLAMFKTYMDITTDGVLAVDRDGIIVEMNKAYCNFLELTRKDVIGHHVTEIIPSTKMTVLIRDKLTDIDDVHYFGDQHVGALTSRSVVLKDGEAIGAIAHIRLLERTSEVALRLQKLHAEVASYKNRLTHVPDEFSFDSIIGEDPLMQSLKKLGHKAARHDVPVLLLGETGTGKEVFAHAIHKASNRATKAFIKVNCAAIPSELLESELFGYENGAFSGARKGGKPGKIELAHEGTLFLDEIADMPLGMQAKLLRVLQDGEVDRLGSVRPRKVNVRIIAATNKDLMKKVAENEFRDDLFYRINVFRLELPALRDRSGDIPLLAAYYLTQLNIQYEMQKCFSHDAENILRKYAWPGNVRELRNVIARAFILADGNLIDIHHLPTELSVRARLKNSLTRFSGMTLENIIKEVEHEILEQALRAHKGNYAQAAKSLGIHRATLYKKMGKGK